ncbi:MAG: LAGLIDADG family homing endonuclease [Candidatus Portnoybacteria bacterium]|nr:LAGLIDADG family homing endonuclease [Candidatus Portnoybacteria bacterium]MDD4982626.1 LAGLIDADG family homing endonuclease [Candidatus Portnoybacteria bacterium]
MIKINNKISKETLAHIIGAAIGDGNLSNPNGRATRLRITCDIKYPNIINNFVKNIKELLPDNKVSIEKHKGACVNISCYSNKWENWLGWKAFGGSKMKQKISVPIWIKKSRKYTIGCLRGLFETDGSVYFDRGYKMANFTTAIPTLSRDVVEMITEIGFNPNLQVHQTIDGRRKYTIRVAKKAREFIELIGINKS